MAFITLNKKKLRYNYDQLQKLFKQNNIEWSVVAKMLCGNEKYLKEVMNLGVKQISDARLTNLEMSKKINPDIDTSYIKPLAYANGDCLVKAEYIIIITDYQTIKL